MQYLIVIHIKPWSIQEPFKKQKPRGWGTGLSIHRLHVQVSKISVSQLKNGGLQNTLEHFSTQIKQCIYHSYLCFYW